MAFQKTMTSEGHFNQIANWKKPGRVAIKTLLDFAKFHPMAPVFPKKSSSVASSSQKSMAEMGDLANHVVMAISNGYQKKT